jgi:hypothetical protein
MSFEETLDVFPMCGNAEMGQRGSGHLAVPGWFLDTEPRKTDPRSEDE